MYNGARDFNLTNKSLCGYLTIVIIFALVIEIQSQIFFIRYE